MGRIRIAQMESQMRQQSTWKQYVSSQPRTFFSRLSQKEAMSSATLALATCTAGTAGSAREEFRTLCTFRGASESACINSEAPHHEQQHRLNRAHVFMFKSSRHSTTTICTCLLQNDSKASLSALWNSEELPNESCKSQEIAVGLQGSR